MIAPAVIAVRPEPGLSATLARGAQAGLAITGCPLFTVRPLAWDTPDPAAFDGLLIGSANAIRYAGEGLRTLATLPVHAVGAETAAAARDAGLQVAQVGQSNLQAVLDTLADRPRHLLRLAGRAHQPLALPPEITVTVRLLYEVEGLPIPHGLEAQLRRGAVVLLHSGEAAAHFTAECDRLGLPRGAIGLAALALRIAERAGPGWRAVSIARSPDDHALLAAAARMCKEWA